MGACASSGLATGAILLRAPASHDSSVSAVVSGRLNRRRKFGHWPWSSALPESRHDQEHGDRYEGPGSHSQPEGAAGQAVRSPTVSLVRVVAAVVPAITAPLCVDAAAVFAAKHSFFCTELVVEIGIRVTVWFGEGG